MIPTRKWFCVTGAIHLQRLHEPAVHTQRKNIEKCRKTWGCNRFMVRKNGHENAPLQVDGAQTKQTKKDKPTNKQTDVFHVFLCRTLFISINLIVLSWRHSEVGWICGNKQTWNLGAAFPSHQTKNEVRRLFQRYLVFTLIWGKWSNLTRIFCRWVGSTTN